MCAYYTHIDKFVENWNNIAFGVIKNAFTYSGDLREDNERTQEEIAKLLNVCRTTYSRYETGEVEIPSSRLIELAKHYNTSTDYLLGLTYIKTPYQLYTKFN